MTVLKKSDTFYFKRLIINGYLTAVNLFCSRNEAVEITGYVGICDGKIEMLILNNIICPDRYWKILLQFLTDEQGVDRMDFNKQDSSALTFYKDRGLELIIRPETDVFGKKYHIQHTALYESLLRCFSSGPRRV